ncbi:sigma-54-dependent transcriptional regulator [Sphingosinithalassobacter portus]|uniref:sigma-54-dependent transcriptional regulator n=1 Tax=Stakelama portus TaxID=2676234 RepID=UPI000D6E70E8|nr:sigma-54 dependent transcriptional regulator [Sphingosinithalassobacter portus]
MSEPVKRVAFVDDDADMRASNAQTLELAGYQPLLFDNARSALDHLTADFPGVVVSDLRMPGMDGLQLFAALRERDPQLPVVLITGHGDVATAVRAIQDGAYDFLTKPYPADALLRAVGRAYEMRQVALENRRLRTQAEQAAGASALIGISPAIEQVRRTIAQIGPTSVDVLIEGETGTGKSLVAAMLHRASDRRRRAMVTVDCGALPDQMVEAELFGHVANAFPGARWPRIGRIEAADQGTLFLDHVDLLTQSAQPKLLRAIEAREVVPLGGNEARHLDFRMIATSRQSMADTIRKGGMIDTLRYRLNRFTIALPPLRERPEDIPLLYAHFLDECARRHGRAVPALHDADWGDMRAHDWPGNVRELMHMAERRILEGEGALAPWSFENRPSLSDAVDAFEAQQIRSALSATRGNVSKAVDLLRIPRKTFYDKARRHGIRPSDWRGSGG